MIELYQFRHSPYNEKVRWALDLKRVPHRRRSLLPGPHMGVVKKLTGRTQTPVLVLDDGTAVAGSARILDWLEQQYPEPRLMPDDPAQREQVLAIQRRFDDDIAPRISGPEAVADGIAAGREAMDFVAAHAKATGYLVSDGFTSADISAATTLATLVRPANSPMQSPRPVDSLFAELIAPFQEHAAAQWVRDIYARHRGASADFEGASPY